MSGGGGNLQLKRFHWRGASGIHCLLPITERKKKGRHRSFGGRKKTKRRFKCARGKSIRTKNHDGGGGAEGVYFPFVGGRRGGMPLEERFRQGKKQTNGGLLSDRGGAFRKGAFLGVV